MTSIFSLKYAIEKMSSFPLQLNDYEIKLAMCFSLLFSGVLEAQAGGDRVRMGCG